MPSSQAPSSVSQAEEIRAVTAVLVKAGGGEERLERDLHSRLYPRSLLERHVMRLCFYNELAAVIAAPGCVSGTLVESFLGALELTSIPYYEK